MRDDRRQAFKRIGGLLVGSAAVSSGYYLVTREGSIDEWTSVGSVNELPVDDVVLKRVSVTEHGLISDKPVEKVVWLRRRSGGALDVLSGACPHNNCTANWIPERTQFDCRCHNSVFDPSGKVLSGPAPRSLDSLEHKIEGGILLVRYQKFKKGIPEKEPIS
jgi:Rieske Fe-S protein